MPGEPDDDGDVDDHYDEDDQCPCQGVPGEPDGKLPSQKWCQLARSQNLYDKDKDYSHQFCWIHFKNYECQILKSCQNFCQPARPSKRYTSARFPDILILLKKNASIETFLMRMEDLLPHLF